MVAQYVPLVDRLKTHISTIRLQIRFDKFAKFFILFQDLLHDLQAKDSVIKTFGITDQLPTNAIQFSPLPFRVVFQEAQQNGSFGSLQDKLQYRAAVGGLPVLADGNQ